MDRIDGRFDDRDQRSRTIRNETSPQRGRSVKPNVLLIILALLIGATVSAGLSFLGWKIC
jgi:hypothetical protein